MAIKIPCPGCKSTLSLADESRGKKVRCKKCETSFKVPDDELDPEDETNDDDIEDRPVKKKKKKSKKGISPLLIVIPVVVLALIVVGGVSAYFMTRIPAQQQAKVQPKFEEEVQKPQIFNKIQDGRPGKKGGLGIVDSIRGGVYRAERKVELANINKMYTAFTLETPNRAQHTLENYLAYIKRDYFPVHEAIKEGYYLMNMSAQGGNDIVAGERDIDRQGHLVVLANGSVEYVPEADFKKVMNIK